MIDTQADTRRLGSIDAATSLGRLADAVVVALARRLNGHPLTGDDADALQAASAWLTRLGAQLAKPLDLTRIGEPLMGPGRQGFGPALAAVAIGALGSDRGTGSEVDVLSRLSVMASAVVNGGSSDDAMRMLLQVFESIAEAMISTADTLLSTPAEATWPTTFAS